MCFLFILTIKSKMIVFTKRPCYCEPIDWSCNVTSDVDVMDIQICWARCCCDGGFTSDTPKSRGRCGRENSPARTHTNSPGSLPGSIVGILRLGGGLIWYDSLFARSPGTSQMTGVKCSSPWVAQWGLRRITFQFSWLVGCAVRTVRLFLRNLDVNALDPIYQPLRSGRIGHKVNF